jgi:hypothetical protein
MTSDGKQVDQVEGRSGRTHLIPETSSLAVDLVERGSENLLVQLTFTLHRSVESRI